MQEARAGDRVRLVAVFYDPDPIMIGEEGTIVNVAGYGLGESHWKVLDVCWDKFPQKSYTLVSPPDIVLVTTNEKPKC